MCPPPSSAPRMAEEVCVSDKLGGPVVPPGTGGAVAGSPCGGKGDTPFSGFRSLAVEVPADTAVSVSVVQSAVSNSTSLQSLPPECLAFKTTFCFFQNIGII